MKKIDLFIIKNDVSMKKIDVLMKKTDIFLIIKKKMLIPIFSGMAIRNSNDVKQIAQ